MGALENSDDPDEMQYYMLHFIICCISSGSALFAKIKTTFKDRNTPEFKKKSACDPYPILIVSICLAKSIRIQRVNANTKMTIPIGF